MSGCHPHNEIKNMINFKKGAFSYHTPSQPIERKSRQIEEFQ